MNFLPDNYEVPQGKSNYFKPKEGKYTLRILSSPVLGYQTWNGEGKGAKSEKYKESKGTADEQHFWALKIWNHTEECVQVWEVTQQGIQQAITDLAKSQWGSPVNYDIELTRKGTGKNDTEYKLLNLPADDLPIKAQEEVSKTIVFLDHLFEGKDPFDTTGLPDFVTS